MLNTIYIYHHNDHDGIVAAGILNDYLEKKLMIHLTELDNYTNIEFIMIDYSVELNFDHIDFNKGDEVYFLDYSFTSKQNRDEFEKLLKRRIDGDEVVWIDHHKTSVGLFEEYNIPGIRKEGLCGAAWTYLYLQEYVLENPDLPKIFHSSRLIPVFLKYIDDYDCWKKIYPVTNDFHYGFTASHPTDAIISNLLSSGVGIDKIIFAGEKIQEYFKFENKEYHVDMYGFEFTLPEEHGGYKCFCMNRKGNSLMFGDKIKEYDAVIPFYYVDGKWKYSIFTENDNVDCEFVARSYGGGGHPKAAGWVINELIF